MTGGGDDVRASSQTRYVKRPDGRFAGSIGSGKTAVPAVKPATPVNKPSDSPTTAGGEMVAWMCDTSRTKDEYQAGLEMLSFGDNPEFLRETLAALPEGVTAKNMRKKLSARQLEIRAAVFANPRCPEDVLVDTWKKGMSPYLVIINPSCPPSVLSEYVSTPVFSNPNWKRYPNKYGWEMETEYRRLLKRVVEHPRCPADVRVEAERLLERGGSDVLRR